MSQGGSSRFLKKPRRACGRFLQNLLLLFYARLDEPVQVLRRHGGDLLQNRVQFRIANGGVLDVVVGSRLIVQAGFPITLDVR